MQDVLARQRAAFMAELPVGLAVRKDRLARAAAMIADNAAAFCDALSEDFGHRSREQSMLTDIAASIARSSTPSNRSIAGHGATRARCNFRWGCSAPVPGWSISPRAWSG